MRQYAMVIDLQRCVGCSACAIACKNGNNTAPSRDGQTHNWSDFLPEVSGVFPNVRYTMRPVLCNHCSEPACVAECPVNPQAMFKTDDGIVMHNNERCIGCLACQEACPYSQAQVAPDSIGYSVISYNEAGQPYFPQFEDDRELIAGCTTSGTELARLAGTNPPHATKFRHPDYEAIRRSGIVEKCIFCEHRVKKGQSPHCVEACPSQARIFGDLKDPQSNVSQLLKQYSATVLKPDAGTRPNVYYIRSYSART